MRLRNVLRSCHFSWLYRNISRDRKQHSDVPILLQGGMAIDSVCYFCSEIIIKIENVHVHGAWNGGTVVRSLVIVYEHCDSLRSVGAWYM